MILPKLPNDLIIKILHDRKIIKQDERFKKQFNLVIFNIEAISEFVHFDIDMREGEIKISKEMLMFIHHQELMECNLEEMFHEHLMNIIHSDP